MISLNTVILAGRITKDAEVKEVGQVTKRKLAKFGMVFNRDYYTGSGKKSERLFIDVQAWEKQAAFIEKNVRRGDFLFVEGELVMEQWRSKLGELKSKITIRAKNVQKDYSKSKDKTGEEENGGDESSDVEKNAPPTENKHRYSKDDCEPYSSPKAESEEPGYDDGVVPF